MLVTDTCRLRPRSKQLLASAGVPFESFYKAKLCLCSMVSRMHSSNIFKGLGKHCCVCKTSEKLTLLAGVELGRFLAEASLRLLLFLHEFHCFHDLGLRVNRFSLLGFWERQDCVSYVSGQGKLGLNTFSYSTNTFGLVRFRKQDIAICERS